MLKKITTEDNTITFYNPEYDECYHTKAGAFSEAIKKFVEPSDFKNTLEGKDKVLILDICFGLGYNSLAAINEIRKYYKDIEINIYCLENDYKILEEIINLNLDILEYKMLKKMIVEMIDINNKNISNKNNTIDRYQFSDLNVNFYFLIGDAVDSIKMVDKGIDFIYLDPFSPKKCPNLWTESFFSNIKNVCSKDAILFTYSCARIVRDNLKNAGFGIKDGPVFGRRSPGTIAFFNIFY
jgi:tRNA U34 5-methylaminomethyl-2-thiouridine-forming methyltransferase MnmC